jgi:two-component system KDP operon response regulator KdpE
MSKVTILVVDDDVQIRRILLERPDVILLDVNMADMNGLEACSKIRKSFAGPIIMVTVRNAEHDKIAALDSGADDYIVKPFGMGELLARIRATNRRLREITAKDRVT